MSQSRNAGYVSIDGEPYLVSKDPKSLSETYSRSSTPKKAVQSTRRNASTGQSNLLDIKFSYSEGIGDENATDGRDTLHYSMNLFTERTGEAVVLPGMLRLDPEENADPILSDANMIWNAPAFVWEQGDTLGGVETYFLGDHRAFNIHGRTNMSMALDEDMFFENDTRPTGGCTFNNYAYAAMGGGQNSHDRYIRRRTPITGIWTYDDNAPLTIDSVATNAGFANYHSTSAQTPAYQIGDTVFISGSSVAGYNGLQTITAVTDSTHFTTTIAFSATATATANIQDSDVQAEQLCIVGDEMVRTFYDVTSGWQTSRVDIVASNELLVANWTAGIGTLNAGDKYSKPTALIPLGDGELLMKPEGVFKYSQARLLYANEIPELEQHRHPDNGKGSFQYKGWVYIPTVIGLLRWKNGITQDVTPGRGGIQGFDTPIGPIAAITGDANRMYAVTQPFKINQPQSAATTRKHFAYAQGGGFSTPSFSNEAYVFDGDQATGENLSSLATDGFLYFGSKNRFHRVFMKFAEPGTTSGGVTNATGNQTTGGSSLTCQVWADTDGDGVGDAWTTKTIYYDGTRGWSKTENDPTSLFQSGDVVFGPIRDSASGEHTWKSDASLAGGPVNGALTADFYWMRLGISATPSGTFVLMEADFGLHSDNALEPNLTPEMATDHGGMVFVLSMTEAQGKGVIWRHLWSLAVPDVLRGSGKVYGGPQKVGIASIVQPGFSRAALNGDRYLFIGMQNLSYLCPLGNHPDPTSQPYSQQYDFTDSGIEHGSRPVVLVTPVTDCGMATENKVLKEIAFLTEGVDLSSTEIWYSVDNGGWTFAGFADDCVGTAANPNMPFVFAAGAEPSGYSFAVAIIYESENETPLRADRFFDLILRVQPRPEMTETIRMTIELDNDQQLPGMVKRLSATAGYAALLALQHSSVTVPFRNISGDTEDVHVLQVSQRVLWNSDQKPRLIADIIMAVGSARDASV